MAEKDWPEEISLGLSKWFEKFVYKSDQENFGAREYQSFGKEVGGKVYGDCDEAAMGGAKRAYPGNFWWNLLRGNIGYITCRHDPNREPGPNNHARLRFRVGDKDYYWCNIDPTVRDHPNGPDGQFFQHRERSFVEVLDRFVTSKLFGKVIYNFTYVVLSIFIVALIYGITKI